MKIIIIILICLFFSLTINPINEFITNPTLPAQTTTAGPLAQPQTTELVPVKPQPQPESSSLQTQVNMLSTQMTTTNAIAQESKKKVDDIASQIDQLKEALKKAPDT